jgi:hypothetical protein
VDVFIGEPIDTTGVSDRDLSPLIERTRVAIQAALDGSTRPELRTPNFELRT